MLCVFILNRPKNRRTTGFCVGLPPTPQKMNTTTCDNYYTILGVQANAPPGEIKAAYRRLALAHHPDRNPPELREEAETQFKRVSEAYEVLIDPETRARYDRVGGGSFISFKSPQEVFAQLFGADENSSSAADDFRVEMAEPQQPFNLPLFEYYMVIDLRSVPEYRASHVVTSMNFPECADVATTANDKAWIAALQSHTDQLGPPERGNPVVLISDGRHPEHLEATIRLLQSDVQGLSHSLTRWLSKVKLVWVVNFHRFQSIFPCMCRQVNPESEMSPTPHWIAHGLWLGSRAVEHSEHSLRRFGISHMIVDAEQQQRVPGVCYCVCACEDLDEQSMSACWDVAIPFIQNA